jgi:hypothetical protein
MNYNVNQEIFAKLTEEQIGICIEFKPEHHVFVGQQTAEQIKSLASKIINLINIEFNGREGYFWSVYTGGGNGSLTGCHRCCGVHMISNGHGVGNGIGFGFGRYTTCGQIEDHSKDYGLGGGSGNGLGQG